MVEITKVLNGFKVLIVDDSDDISDPTELVFQCRPELDDRLSELEAFKEMILDIATALEIHYDGFSKYNLEIRTDLVGDEIESAEDNI